MRKLLKCGGSPILNFRDLQSSFSPMELYAQLDTFHNFAAVHCVPLPLQLTDKKTGGKYQANYLTKQFWQQVLYRLDWPTEAKSAKECLDLLLQDTFPTQEEYEKFLEICRKKMEKERSDAKLYDKLCSQEKYGKFLDTCWREAEKKKKYSDPDLYYKLRSIDKVGVVEEAHRKAVLLLAIGELARINVQDDHNEHDAEYLTKQFWQQILDREEWPTEAKSAKDFLDILLQEVFPMKEKDEKLQGKIEKEASDAKLYDKLSQIVQMAAEQDHQKMVLLLAISELAGINVQDDHNEYDVKYLTKQFWQQILDRKQWPTEAKSARDCLDVLLQDALPTKEEDEKFREQYREKIGKEVSDAKLYDKLSHIVRMAAVERDHRKAVLLLAISELAEVDVRKTGAGDWDPLPSSGETDASAARKEERGGDAGPDFFSYDDTAYLTATSHVYKYWYHDEDALAPEAEIQTVKIVAKAGRNQYAAVRIELYSMKTKRLVDKIKLKSGEYRYCTVSRGRIIKFLPSVSICDDLCLVRPEYGKPDIQVISSGAEAWTLDGEGISSFSAGGVDRGFLLLQDGRVNFQFFKDAEDFSTRLTLEIISKPAVEVLIRRGGYEVLLADGTTVTGNLGDRRTGVVTLDPAGRYPRPTVTGFPDLREVAVSESRRGVVILNNSFSRGDVHFAGEAGGPQVKKENGGIVITP